MHQNPAFRQTAEDVNRAFARERGFGTLTVNGSDGPLVSHVPFLLDEDGGVAEFHLMRSNPIARQNLPAAAVIAVTGPDGYVSPDWYEIDDQVPTWNYVAVHLRGSLEPVNPEGLRAHLDRLSAHFEAGLSPKPPWTADKTDARVLERMLRMILPFRLVLNAVEGTWKLNQNKPDTARRAAAQEVQASTIGQETRDLAMLMLGVQNNMD